MDAVVAFRYRHGVTAPSHAYLLPAVRSILEERKPARIFEIGCGQGGVANELSNDGFEVIGVDPSPEGIATARQHFPHLRLKAGSAYDDLAGHYGRFPCVLSLEVVEHLYSPRLFARSAYELLEPGGVAVISTPYHSYLKNLALALSGKMDRHWDPLWDHGHIKFWSERTLGALLTEAGFEEIRFMRVGRFPALAKSMIAVGTKPGEPPIR